MSRDLAGALAKGLHDAGVRMIFGMPGGGPNLDMIGCAEQLGIDFVLAHGETAACIMAASYGKLTDTPGTAVVTRGPGLTSCGCRKPHPRAVTCRFSDMAEVRGTE